MIGWVCGPQRTTPPCTPSKSAGHCACASARGVTIGAIGTLGLMGAPKLAMAPEETGCVCGPQRTGNPVAILIYRRPVSLISAQICPIVIVRGAAAAITGAGAVPPQSIVWPVVLLTKPGCGPLRPTQNAALV